MVYYASVVTPTVFENKKWLHSRCFGIKKAQSLPLLVYSLIVFTLVSFSLILALIIIVVSLVSWLLRPAEGVLRDFFKGHFGSKMVPISHRYTIDPRTCTIFYPGMGLK